MWRPTARFLYQLNWIVFSVVGTLYQIQLDPPATVDTEVPTAICFGEAEGVTVGPGSVGGGVTVDVAAERGIARCERARWLARNVARGVVPRQS